MEKFNNTSLFTGYLKQLLGSFNLPKYRVYTRENLKYHNQAIKNNNLPEDERPEDWHPMLEESPEIIESILADKRVDSSNKDSYNKDTRYINYIKNNKIQRYINGKWVDTPWHYHYNKKELNQTKNLVIKNNTYDSYTHEYLGEFLRFQRDYNNIDLMPLYNCFSNTICQHLDFSNSSNVNQNLEGFKISTDLSYNYKIYMVPVKLFKKYTIAIDCSSPVEICCGFYTKYQDTREKLRRMPAYTYKKINNCIFGQPFVYDKLSYEALSNAITSDSPAQDPATVFISNIAEFAQYETELKMFIKIPIENNSTITILEGDYSGYNQGILLGKSTDGKWYTAMNHFITNYETKTIGEKTAVINNEPAIENNYKEIILPSVNERDFTPYTYLQLLLTNTKESYPFADRLVEYLIGNVITENDNIMDNIVRAQKTMELNGWKFDIDGSWEPKMRNIAYDYFMSTTNDFNTSNITFVDKLDCLGYIDKDIEKYYTGWRKEFKLDKDGNRIKTGETEPEYTVLNTLNPTQTLTEAQLQILRDSTSRTVDVYETIYTQVSSISNMDIYPDIYKDSKKEDK